MNYIDIKVTVWHRLHFTDRANMPGIADIIKDTDVNNVVDKKIGYTNTEIIWETEEVVTPTAEKPEATIKVYETLEMVWNNEIK